MPIRSENRHRYPADWPAISKRIRFERAGGRCECDGRCRSRHHRYDARCRAVHGDLHPSTGSMVVLTTAHLDHVPEHSVDENLLAMCQACHLAYDRDHHHRTQTGMEPLFGEDGAS